MIDAGHILYGVIGFLVGGLSVWFWFLRDAKPVDDPNEGDWN